jgi:hypothetical protein
VQNTADNFAITDILSMRYNNKQGLMKVFWEEASPQIKNHKTCFWKADFGIQNPLFYFLFTT